MRKLSGRFIYNVMMNKPVRIPRKQKKALKKYRLWLNNNITDMYNGIIDDGMLNILLDLRTKREITS